MFMRHIDIGIDHTVYSRLLAHALINAKIRYFSSCHLSGVLEASVSQYITPLGLHGFPRRGGMHKLSSYHYIIICIRQRTAQAHRIIAKL